VQQELIARFWHHIIAVTVSRSLSPFSNKHPLFFTPSLPLRQAQNGH